MTGLMQQAMTAFWHLLRRNDVDPDGVTIIICADNPLTQSKIERALFRDFDQTMLTLDPRITGPREAQQMTAFKLHGVRVVLSDLTHEEPMYLITKDAPR